MISKIKKAIDNPRLILIHFVQKFGFWLPDKLYLQLLFYGYMGKRLNLKNPQTFSEKLQWLKLYDRRPDYTTMVDKYAVKKYVADIIGEEYIIPTLGVWDNFDDIDFDSLPNQFVLKTTHGGGNTGVVICKDKSTFNIEAARTKMNRSFKQNIYRSFREWPYKNVPKRIIAEKYVTDSKGELNDYKFFCFNGEPKVMLMATERKTGVKFDYFDTDFNHLPFEQGGPNSNKKLERPACMDKMIELSRMLAQNIAHVRVDLYDVDGKIYFGELTFFDSSGLAEFYPEEWNYKFGSLLCLPQKN